MASSRSYSDLRRNLKAACDHVCEHHEPLFVERRRGGDVVLLSREDFDALEETAYLLRAPENARRLLEALSRTADERSRFASIRDLAREVGS